MPHDSTSGSRQRWVRGIAGTTVRWRQARQHRLDLTARLHGNHPHHVIARERARGQGLSGPLGSGEPMGLQMCCMAGHCEKRCHHASTSRPQRGHMFVPAQWWATPWVTVEAATTVRSAAAWLAWAMATTVLAVARKSGVGNCA